MTKLFIPNEMKSNIYACHSAYTEILHDSSDCISGVMVKVLASGAVDRGLKPWSGHLLLQHQAGSIEEWLALNRDNMSEDGHVYT